MREEFKEYLRHKLPSKFFFFFKDVKFEFSRYFNGGKTKEDRKLEIYKNREDITIVYL